MEIKIEIKTCKDCPFFDIVDTYSTDGWDRMEDWVCTKMNPTQEIASAVEWYEEKDIKIPDWCPSKI